MTEVCTVLKLTRITYISKLCFPWSLFYDMQGNIVRWLKKEGDQVSPGEVLCEVETVSFFYCLRLKSGIRVIVCC